MSTLAYLASASPTDLPRDELFARCDGLKGGCLNTYYHTTFAIGKKNRNVATGDVVACWSGPIG